MSEKNAEKSIVKAEMKMLLPFYLAVLGIELLASFLIGLGAGMDYRLFLGAIVGTILSVLSFLLMAISAEKTLHVHESKVKNFSLGSYAARYIGLFLILGALMYFRLINPITAVIPLFVPKIAYTISAAFQKSEF